MIPRKCITLWKAEGRPAEDIFPWPYVKRNCGRFQPDLSAQRTGGTPMFYYKK
jgi:hypothetical protein